MILFLDDEREQLHLISLIREHVLYIDIKNNF
jgi:hypothetical protein